MIRLGRIAYVNMAPVFYRLEADVEEVVGVPTALNRQLIAGELDVAPISSIEYARNADRLRLLPRLCVSSEGAVESIQLISKTPLDTHQDGRGDARVGDVGGADEGAAPRRRARAARRGGGGEAPDRRRGAPLGVRGPDAAPRSRPAVARAHRACRWCSPSGRRPSRCIRSSASSRTRSSRRSAPRAPSPSGSPTTRRERYGYPAGFLARYFEKLRYRFGPRERAGLYTFLELARDVGELDEVPELRFVVAGATV